MFPFGFGLSYTTFEYRNANIHPKSFTSDQSVTVTFDVTNTGKREGAEIAQVYVRDVESSVPRPMKELKAFQKVRLKPGEKRNVTMELDRSAFSFYDVKQNGWNTEAGEFEILIGSSSRDMKLKQAIVLR